MPRPIIFATQGDTITITLRNTLPVVSSFFVKGMVNVAVPAGTPRRPIGRDQDLYGRSRRHLPLFLTPTMPR